jgi:hypothetical protein
LSSVVAGDDGVGAEGVVEAEITSASLLTVVGRYISVENGSPGGQVASAFRKSDGWSKIQ